jgi:hypothetical protein
MSKKKHTLTSKVKSVSQALVEWSKNDFGLTTDKQYNERYQKCLACKSFNPTGYNNTGECTECGCSTIAKLKLISSRCDLGHWEAIKP